MRTASLFDITYGLFVISTYNGKKLNGYIGNTVMQISSEPLKIAIACSKNNFTANMIIESKAFAISILHKEVKMDTISRFGYKSGKDIDKFNDISYKTGITGCPILIEDTKSWIECKLIDKIDVGTHCLFIGEVVDCDIINDKEPITYDYYHKVFKVKSPKNAPTYQQDSQDKKMTLNNNNLTTKKEENMNFKKYQCEICGYVYDPALGDPDSGIAPGTKFEDLPEDWCCPVCGVDKSNFKPVE